MTLNELLCVYMIEGAEVKILSVSGEVTHLCKVLVDHDNLTVLSSLGIGDKDHTIVLDITGEVLLLNPEASLLRATDVLLIV